MASKSIFSLLLFCVVVGGCSKGKNLNLISPKTSAEQALSTPSNLDKIANDSSSSTKELVLALESNSVSSLEAISKSDENIVTIAKQQKKTSQNDKEAYLKLILDTLSIPTKNVEVKDADVKLFVESLLSYIENLEQEQSLLKDLYLIRSLQNLANYNQINGNSEGANDELNFDELKRYLHKKYQVGEKSNADILCIYAAIITMPDAGNEIIGGVRKILTKDILSIENAPGVNFLLTRTISVIAGEYKKEDYGVQGDDAKILVDNILNFTQQLANNFASKTNKDSIVDTIKCLDNSFYFFEENVSYLLGNNLNVEKLSDNYWLKKYRTISKNLIEIFPEKEKTNVAFNFSPKSLLMKSIKFEKDRIYPTLNGIFDIKDATDARSKNIDFFKTVLLLKNDNPLLNYPKEMAYGIYLHSVLSYILSFDSVVDAPIKVRAVQNELKKIKTITDNKSEKIDLDIENDFLTKGTFTLPDLTSTKNLIIHPLAYVKTENLSLEFNTIEGGIFDVSAEDVLSENFPDVFAGTIPSQLLTSNNINHHHCWKTLKVWKWFEECDGDNTWEHVFRIKEGIAPDKANSGATGNKSGVINLKLKSQNIQYSQPIFLANGGKGGQGQTGMKSPLCKEEAGVFIYQQIKLRSGVGRRIGEKYHPNHDPYSTLEANVTPEVNNGIPGDGGVGGNGGEINIQFSKVESKPIISKFKSKLSAKKKNKILATVIGGSGGDAGLQSSCKDKNTKPINGNYGEAGSAGKLTIEE